MSIIPEVKCRRCGQTFSSLRSTCPNCGIRVVSQSGRTPGATPGTVKGTASYERAEANTRWQMIFGLILVVAVILAVIVMVSTTLSGNDNAGGGKMTPPPTINISQPVVESAPTPTPSPPPTVQKVEIKYITTVLTLDNAPTMHMGEAPLTLNASVYPLDIENPVIEWSCDHEDVLQVTPKAGTNECEVKIIGTIAGGVKVTATCYGVEASCRIYCVQ